MTADDDGGAVVPGAGDGRGGALERWLLRAIVFVCGAVLMGLEIVGSRLLAPSFGTSIFVWGSLIGVFLAALSLGYWLGGRLADRAPRLAVLAGLVGAAGALVFVLPFLYRPLNHTIAASGLGARAGPLVASTLLFFVPGILLGTVSPFAVRLEVTAVGSVGATAGALYALSTAGSIAGTIGTAFFLIPALRVPVIVHGLGMTLLVTAALAAAGRGRLAALAATGMLVLSWVAAERLLPRDPKILVDADSAYVHLVVRDERRIRYLDTDLSLQGAMSLDEPDELQMKYVQMLALALAWNPEPRRVLAVGLGAGSFPRRLHRDYPEAVIDVVEIDPVVRDLARTYFGFVEDERLRVHLEDGRRFVREATGSYDLIVLDAYGADTVPFHLTTREFLRDVAARTTADGVVVANVVANLRGPFLPAVVRTFASVFPVVNVFPVSFALPAQERNVIVVATGAGRPLGGEEVAARLRALRGRMAPLEVLLGYARQVHAPSLEGVPLLSDEWAPVEMLRAR